MGGYHDARGGYHEYRGGCSVPGGVQCRGGNPLLFEYHLSTPTVLMISPDGIQISKDGFSLPSFLVGFGL